MPDTGQHWIKAKRSYASTQCVELATADDEVLMRSSRSPEVLIRHTAAEFAVFLEAAKNGEFDHLVAKGVS